jgi:hypothetical protein
LANDAPWLDVRRLKQEFRPWLRGELGHELLKPAANDMAAMAGVEAREQVTSAERRSDPQSVRDELKKHFSEKESIEAACSAQTGMSAFEGR